MVYMHIHKGNKIRILLQCDVCGNCFMAWHKLRTTFNFKCSWCGSDKCHKVKELMW